MVLKNVVAAVVCAALLAWSGPAAADEYRPDRYRPDQFLGLDLSKAVLSPKPLGPRAEFEPVPVQAMTDRESEGAQASAEPKAEPSVAVRSIGVAHLRTEKPHAAARAKLARRHGDPLDAEARDTRIQVWPCKSGGICDWKR